MTETKTTMQLQEEWLKEARIRLAGLKAMKASKEDIHARNDIG